MEGLEPCRNDPVRRGSFAECGSERVPASAMSFSPVAAARRQRKSCASVDVFFLATGSALFRRQPNQDQAAALTIGTLTFCDVRIQVLCDGCNLQKGSWDETDFRTPDMKSRLAASFRKRAKAEIEYFARVIRFRGREKVPEE